MPRLRSAFTRAIDASHTVAPRVITVDKNPAYPKAVREMKAAGVLAVSCELRQSKYLNNLIEQDHRFIKRLVKPCMGFFSFHTAWQTLRGYEAMNMIRKGVDEDHAPPQAANEPSSSCPGARAGRVLSGRGGIVGRGREGSTRT
jgi:transposase-like protein